MYKDHNLYKFGIYTIKGTDNKIFIVTDVQIMETILDLKNCEI